VKKQEAIMRPITTTTADYEDYLKRSDYVYSGKERPDGQSFAEAMCEGSTVEGLENGEEILDIIRKAGN
jgi:hypothetical protein